MTYADYLRARAAECVKLAVDASPERAAELIDLAQDFSERAHSADLNDYGARLLREEQCGYQAAVVSVASSTGAAPHPMQKLISWFGGTANAAA